MKRRASSPHELHSRAPPNDLAHEISDSTRLVTNPLISILMITFNHSEFIGAAIRGVVSQESNYEFELIIGEDHSTDDTLSKVLYWQKCFPEIIRIVHSNRNVGIRENGLRVLKRARGKYLAFCEGDDFWCSKSKLSDQIRILEDNPEYCAVHADWIRLPFKGANWSLPIRASEHARIPLSKLQGDLFSLFYFSKILRTCTLVVRREVANAAEECGLRRPHFAFGDTVYAAYMTSRWPVAYLPKVVSVYRESPNSALRSGKQARIKFLKAALEFDSLAREYFANRRDYPYAYRWELAIGLIFCAASVCDWKSCRFAWRDVWRNYGMFGSIKAAWVALSMRRPLLRAHLRPIDVQQVTSGLARQ